MPIAVYEIRETHTFLSVRYNPIWFRHNQTTDNGSSPCRPALMSEYVFTPVRSNQVYLSPIPKNTILKFSGLRPRFYNRLQNPGNCIDDECCSLVRFSFKCVNNYTITVTRFIRNRIIRFICMFTQFQNLCT